MVHNSSTTYYYACVLIPEHPSQAGDEEMDRESERERTLRDRPGPTPATVKRIYHNTGIYKKNYKK
jgi:hypothetical protein